MSYYPYRHRPDKPRSRTSIIFALLAFSAILAWASIATYGKVSQPERGTLIVGTNTPFPPFEIRKGEEVVGFDIDLAKKIASALGRKLIVKDFNEFDALFPALADGKSLDMAISSITIREDRKEVVSFSDSYFKSSQALLTKSGSNLTYSGNPESLNGLKVGYQEATTSQSWVEENFGKGSPNLIPFGDVSIGLQMLLTGSVDIIVIDEPVAVSFAKTNSMRVLGTIETGEEYGIVVAKDDSQKLLPQINKTIKELKETGEYDKLLAKWFGGGAEK